MAAHDPSEMIWEKRWVGRPTDTHFSAENTSPLARRDDTNKLVTHATLGDLVNDDDFSAGSHVNNDDDDDDDDIPLGALAVVGAVAGVAYLGVRWLEHKERQRHEREIEEEKRSSIATPAIAPGWYGVPSDPARLRYWNGTAWTDQYAQTQVDPPTMPAGWYPDPHDPQVLWYWDGSTWTSHVRPPRNAPASWYPDNRDPLFLRYWDGGGWTSHFQPTYGAPANWYPDLQDLRFLRYWDGAAWTHHVRPHDGALAAVAYPAATPMTITARMQAHPTDVSRTSMTSAQWQEHFRAWLAATAMKDELWERLNSAQLEDDDCATLEAKREIESLTPEQANDRVRLMIAHNPSLPIDAVLAEFVKVHGGRHRAAGDNALSEGGSRNASRLPPRNQ